MKSKNRQIMGYLGGAVLLCVLLLLDQWTKHLAVRFLKDREDVILIPGVLRLHYLENRGAAFGILQNQQWLFYVLTVAILLMILYLLIRMPKTMYYFPVHILGIVVIAGALGNFYDRLVHRYVVDFFYFELIDFPVFNVADVYLTCSILLFLLLFFFRYKEEDFSFIMKKRRTEKQE